ncbi:MAG: phage virion morphogenesis protein [Alphaproteobacteria bacterium]|nr:phage virion morphogenesis protein [Alphaproteobacteria bacterium]
MITAALTGADALQERLAALPSAAARRLAQTIESLGLALREDVQRKLSGAVLQQRSGRLAASITARFATVGGAAEAAIGTDVVYAAIHEYGGRLPAREVMPQGARALAFPWKGKQRFFKRVEIPAVTMPERSFLRAALDEMAPEIREAVAAAVREAVRS